MAGQEGHESSEPFAESLASNGFAVIRRFAAESASIEVARSLGEIDSVEGLDPVQTLTPLGLGEAPPNTYSGNFGRRAFPLHTDLAHWARPPRYITLRCIRGAPNVATRVLDGWTLVAGLGSERLRMSLVQPRRPMRNGKQLLRLLEHLDDSSFKVIRWDSLYLRPASPLAENTFEEMRSFLSRAKPTEVTLVDQGDLLIIDNWRCLHGRSEAAESDRTRRIDRVYLKELR